MVEMNAVLGLLAGPVGSGGTVVQLTTQVVLLVVVIIFGFIGFRRGAQREFLVTLGIIFASVLVQSKLGHDWLVFWANRMYKLVLFVLRGGLGASDPSAVWAKIRALPNLITTPQQQLYLTLIVFVVIVLLAYPMGYLVAPKKKARQRNGESAASGERQRGQISILIGIGIVTATQGQSLSLSSRLLGLILGAVNGYLILRFWLPRLLPTAKTIVVIPSGSVADFLGQNISYVFITIVAVLVFLGWQASSKKRKEESNKK